MFGWLKRKSSVPVRKHVHRPAKSHLGFDLLEDRTTPAVMTASEVHALQVINYARSDPAAFAQDLKSLFLGGNTYTSPMGYKANDPVWTDLRNEIAAAESRAGGTWKSGFLTTGANTFLTYMSSLPALPPIAWNSTLQDGAIAHSNWMFTNFFTHSVTVQGQLPPAGESPSQPIPGIPRNFNVVGDFFDTSALTISGENIGFAFNVLPNTVTAYRNHQITLDGYNDRLVYADIIAFMMEYDNGSTTNPWGHLNNLIVNPSNPTFYFTELGLSNKIYENQYEPEKGTPQSYFSTHRFGTQVGHSWANVLVYEDVNGNGFYDAGEGRPAKVTFASNVSGSNSDTGTLLLNGTGYTSSELLSPYSTYTFNATYLGKQLTPQVVTRDGSNRTVVFKYVAPVTPVLTGLRSSDITFGADGAWWGMDGDTGVTHKLAQWTSNAAANWQFVSTGDFNGDGRTDLAAYSRGQWWVGLQTATGFVTSLWTGWSSGANWTDVNIADMNGDGASDIVARYAATGQWWVALSNGANGFNNALFATWSAGAGWHDTQVGDLNADGKADIASRTSGGQWWVGKSNGAAFATTLGTAWTESAGWRNVQKADVNGDGKMDLIGRTSNGQWWVSVSTGTSFTTSLWTTWTESAGWNTVLVGDFDGDGKSDIVGRENSGNCWVSLSNGTKFTTTLWGVFTTAVPWGNFHVGDVDGDGRSDFIGRTSTTWWVGAGANNSFFNRIMGNLPLSYLFAKTGKVESAIYNS